MVLFFAYVGKRPVKTADYTKTKSIIKKKYIEILFIS